MDTVVTVVSEAQTRRDRDHLRLLAVFHFVVAALALLGIGFLGLHFWMMHSFVLHPEIFANGHLPEASATESFAPFFRVFVWFYVVMGAFFAAAAVLDLLSGIFLFGCRFRTFSLVVAGFNCIQVPFGTVLGVLTLIVLMRDSVRLLYLEPDCARTRSA